MKACATELEAKTTERGSRRSLRAMRRQSASPLVTRDRSGFSRAASVAPPHQFRCPEVRVKRFRDEKLKAMVQDEDNFEVWYKDQAAQYSHCDVSEPGHLIYVPVKEGEKVQA